MDVPQPQQVHVVVVMRDAVHAREDDGVDGARRARVDAERGHRHRAGLARRTGAHGKGRRIRNPPVDVEMDLAGRGRRLHVVALRAGELEVALGRARPPSRREGPLPPPRAARGQSRGRCRRARADAAHHKSGTCTERPAFQQQDVDAAGRERVEQAGRSCSLQRRRPPRNGGRAGARRAEITRRVRARARPPGGSAPDGGTPPPGVPPSAAPGLPTAAGAPPVRRAQPVTEWVT